MLLINHVIFCSKINYFTVNWVGLTYIYIYIYVRKMKMVEKRSKGKSSGKEKG